MRIRHSRSHKIKNFHSKPFSGQLCTCRIRDWRHCGNVDGSMYVQWDIQSLSEVDSDTLLPVLVVSGTPIGQAGRGGGGGGGQRGGQLDMSIGHWTLDSWTCPITHPLHC